jgi:hypothetical protein
MFGNKTTAAVLGNAGGLGGKILVM